jgi:hypothetical protein
MSKIKKAAKPLTVKQLQERINKACGWLGDINMWPGHLKEHYYAVDQAVRLLQGKNYKKFINDLEDELDNPYMWWHTEKD